MATEHNRADGGWIDRKQILYYLHVVVYSLAVILALSLLVVGTIAVIAEIKGTWHWQIHLESTISYMGVFVSWVLSLLVPLFGLLVIGRWRWSDG
jgi:hypothetical protein